MDVSESGYKKTHMRDSCEQLEDGLGLGGVRKRERSNLVKERPDGKKAMVQQL